MILSDSESPEAAVWQLVESCGYTADLPVWSELTEGRGSVLDLGCGIGRVARHLAIDGRQVVGVDLDPVLVDDLNRLSGEELVTGLTGDATDLSRIELGRANFDAVVAPQQLLHIVGGEAARRSLIESASRHLAPDGIAGFAISEWIPEESREVDVLPDVREIGDWVYASRPVAVEDDGDRLTVIRLRQIVAPDGSLTESEDRITLDRLDRDRIAEELSAAGLKVERTIDVPETDRHIATVILAARHGNGSARL